MADELAIDARAMTSRSATLKLRPRSEYWLSDALPFFGRPKREAPATAADRTLPTVRTYLCIAGIDRGAAVQADIGIAFDHVRAGGRYCSATALGMRCRCGTQLEGHDPGDEDVSLASTWER